MVKRADLLQRVGKRIVADVVKEGRGTDYRLLVLTDRGGIFRFAKERQSASGKMMRSQSVLEPGMRRAGVDEISPTELADVSQSLEDLGVDKAESQRVDADVVPDGVAQYLEVHGPRCARYPFGPAFLIAGSTLPNFSKFSRNMPASFFACAS